MRKKKTETQLEIAPPTAVFKLKFTNLRKTAYPDVPIQGDIDDIKIGDLLTRNTMGTVFEVVHIHRDVLQNADYSLWEHRNRQTTNIPPGDVKVTYKNQRMHELLEFYKKNGNFGIVVFSVKAIYRGGKQIAKGKLVKFKEMDNQKHVTWNPYKHIEIDANINTLRSQINNIDFQISRANANKKGKTELVNMFMTLRKKKVLATPITLESGGELLPTALL